MFLNGFFVFVAAVIRSDGKFHANLLSVFSHSEQYTKFHNVCTEYMTFFFPSICNSLYRFPLKAGGAQQPVHKRKPGFARVDALGKDYVVLASNVS